MPISSVPSNAVAQESTARISSPVEIARRDAPPIARPSVITNISPEGRLRAEQEQQLAAPPAAANVIQAAPTQPQEAQPPRRTAAEEANVAADVAAVAAQAVNAVATRAVGNANAADVASDDAVESVTATTSEPRQPEPVVSVVPGANTERPAPAVANAQPVAPAAAAAPEELPARPAESGSRAATEQTAEQLPEQGLDTVRLTQTAKDFVAAFNASQNSRAQVLKRTEPVQQTQASNAAELRPAPVDNAPAGSTSESVASVAETAPRPEAGSARFDTSTFAVGVARVATAATERPSQAEPVAVNADNESNNDTARLLNDQVRGASAPAPAPAGNVVDAANHDRGAPSAPQVAAAPDPVNQGPAPSTLSKQLNVLANLLTPGQ